MTASLVTKQLRIAGWVQGVGYRASFARAAQELCLSGWVRNRLDGTVEALVQGGEREVSAIIAWAGHGPPLARVDNVLVSDRPDEVVQANGFAVLPTE